ncbi:MAG: insulinase family protein [Candidatus Eisenbacteria bacterium]|nr:insulinase family protein [Candidatus Eisenbacteria bacterium]
MNITPGLRKTGAAMEDRRRRFPETSEEVGMQKQHGARMWHQIVAAAAGLALALSSAGAAEAGAEGFKDLADRVTEIELDNGLRIIVMERHDAPVFTFFTLVDVGGANEVAGITGLAHMFEHMAFKGTTSLGTTDYQAERKALDRVDEAYAAYLHEKRKHHLADPEELAALEEAFKEAQEEAAEYVVTNRFPEVIEEQGGRGLNAFTSSDMTGYFYSLPSNKLELWALLESDRFSNPVLREFYKERDVVIEERRRFSESTPMGRLYTEMVGVTFLAHPYRDGIIGHRSDLETFSRDEAREFYKTHYVANNMVIALVGDVDPDEVRRLAKKYFSRIPEGPPPPVVDTVEPEQLAERRVILEEDAQPVVMIAYHIPARSHPDWYAYEMLADILGSGRTSRLYEKLVKEDKLATRMWVSTGQPGEKYPNLLGITATASEETDPFVLEEAIHAEVRRLFEEGVRQDELDKVRSRVKADFVRRLRSNWGLAIQLAINETRMGDWREMFRELDRIGEVTTDDIHRVARETLKKSNRTVGILKRPDEAAS